MEQINLTLIGKLLTIPDGSIIDLEPLWALYAGLGDGPASDTLEALLRLAGLLPKG